MTEFTPDKNTQFTEKVSFKKGQKIKIELDNGIFEEREVVNVLDSKKAVSLLGLGYHINNPVPIVILDKKITGKGSGHYYPELGVIFAEDDTAPEVMHHEIIHSLEMSKPTPHEMQLFYEKVLKRIPDSANVQPNFRKNIHEFIADAYSKPGFIKTLMDSGLYSEFQKCTQYIFE